MNNMIGKKKFTGLAAIPVTESTYIPPRAIEVKESAMAKLHTTFALHAIQSQLDVVVQQHFKG